MATKERIAELSEAIRYHRELYYNHSTPEISDIEFDILWDELKKLDPDHEVLHQVGPEPLPGTEKVEHMFPMRSLDKGVSDEDIIHFVRQSTSGGKRYLAQPKLDGSALSLEYISGNLHRAATRGSGERGEDVTLNAKLVRNIPSRLNFPYTIHVRGEVVMPIETFQKKYSEVSPNPRNLCSGALRQKHGDGKASASDLVFCAYDVKFPLEAPAVEYDSELLDWLQKAGIKPAPWQIFESEGLENEMIEYTKEWNSKRANYEYEIDGIVFKLDELNHRERLGMTAHHPRWALAWKFPPEIAETVLLEVTWQTGRTGNITPVGKVAPQRVGGVTVENVTLHNPGEVEKLGISIGDKVKLVRRGDVIPKIESVLGPGKDSDLANRTHADGTNFSGKLPPKKSILIPNVCPACNGETIMEGAFLKCTNINCIARLSRSLIYWCRSLEMDGIGEKLIDQLIESGLVSNISDLYRVNVTDLSKLERMAQKSAENVYREINNTKRIKLSKFLHALGLPGIGPELANLIANEFKRIDDIIQFVTTNDDLRDDSRLIKIEGIGESVILLFVQGINDRLEVIESIIELVVITEEEQIVSSGHLEGKKFCITGSLSMSRKEIEISIKNAGGKILSSVSKKLDYLISGESSGSKLDKAVNLGITILSEEELNEILEAKDKKTKNLFDY